MSRASYLILLGVAVAIGTPILAFGQAAGDLGIERIRQEHPDAGILFFNLTLLYQDPGNRSCTPTTAELTANPRVRKTAEFEVFRPNPLFSWKAESRGSFVALQPATYTITSIHCVEASHDFNFKGPVAQIRVDPGEIVNAGNVVLNMSLQPKIDFLTPPKMGAHVKVEDLTPETIASLKTRAPETFAKAKRRYFTIDASMK